MAFRDFIRRKVFDVTVWLLDRKLDRSRKELEAEQTDLSRAIARDLCLPPEAVSIRISVFQNGHTVPVVELKQEVSEQQLMAARRVLEHLDNETGPRQNVRAEPGYN